MMHDEVPVERYFMEKSRRKKPGNVKVTENYLRTDVHCGLKHCRLCEGVSPPLLCLEPQTTIVVPDSSFLVCYIDLFNDVAFQADQILFLQSVLDRAGDVVGTREASQIDAWLSREGDRALLKTFGYFPNKHMIDTYAPTHVFEVASSKDTAIDHTRLDIESMEQRDRRLIANAMAWYSSHSPATHLVLLSDDPLLSSSIPPSLDHVDVLSCADFIDTHCSSGARIDLHAIRAECAHAFQRRQVSPQTFAQHDSNPSACAFQGILDVSTHHPLEAFVNITTEAASKMRSIFIYGRDAMNRAIHGDVVAIELLPETEWLAPESATSLVHHVASTEDELKRAQKKAHPATSTCVSAVPTGRVYVATILSSTVAPGDDYALAVPMDIRIPKIRLRSQNATALVDHRLKVVVDAWAADSTYPQGHYVQILGPVGDVETEIQALLVEHAVHAHPFSEPALACLPDVRDIAVDMLAACDTSKRPHIPLTNDWQVPPEEIAARLDIRSTHRVFSVDPPGCQDIDDAMSILHLPNGRLQLGVHIADVGYFVAPDTALDLEAQNRATTVYLVDRRYDMLPVLLSGDLCSIHCGRDRLAFSVFWEIDPMTLEIVPDATTFSKTILHSTAAMTYYQADRLMDGFAADDPAVPNTVGTGTAGQPIPQALQPSLRHDLLILREIGRMLYRKRASQGAVDLSSGGELKFSKLPDDESGDAGLTVTTKAALEIHSTIAELMILANATVAERLVRAFPESAMLRRHVPPTGNRFDQLVALASAQGLVLDTSTNLTLQRSLDTIQVDDDTLALLKSMATRAMSEAEYICASEATGTQLRFGHYGLGLEYYTHFTSPIRRYADVVVHRQLMATLDNYVPRPPNVFTKGSRVVRRRQAPALPSSLVPSVLTIDATESSASPPSLMQRVFADDQYLLTNASPAPRRPAAASPDPSQLPMLHTDRLVALSQHMNRQNRHSKRVSRACDELFLALYFRSHVSVVQAVVTAIKQNGLLVYLPQFDVRAPVYLKDRDGDVHLHACMVPRPLRPHLRPAKYAFASLGDMAVLPNASLALSSDCLRIVAPDGHTAIATFAPLQEVQVHVSCDFSTASVRLPQLRLLLVSPEKGRDSTGVVHWSAKVLLDHEPWNDSNTRASNTGLTEAMGALDLRSQPLHRRPPPSLYQRLDKAKATAAVASIDPGNAPIASSRRDNKVARSALAKKDSKAVGRVVFGGFEPVVDKKFNRLMTAHYENRSAELEAAMTIERSAIREIGDTRQFEADALRRSDKLMAERRHDRINRRNKANN
ncbi:hypothetical protein DYB32_004218 [Aphanomyces invadans]|uniref:DIS3-like exonuclease 1 n=1 Tax=Aphanomyces invadans TaxID=157072 RepID=A0A418AY43_9STRA|nr:hypothetical protein DYB32_004218 [Aphanomyces invadans]